MGATGEPGGRQDLPPFSMFFASYRTVVYRYLIARVGPDAEDCFQETFLAALRAYRRLPAGSNLRAWVLKIAERKAIDASRARSRRPVPVAQPPEAEAVSGNGLDPELWRAVARLPAKQRTAIAQRFIGDLPYAQVAATMGTSEEAARRNVHEGLKNLRREGMER